MRKLIIHNHLPAHDKKPTNDANQAYIVKVRRLATGADFAIRLFAASQSDAENRAMARARQKERAGADAVYRVVESRLDPDQSRPSYDKAYQETEGEAAAKAGKGVEANPYPAKSEPARRWRDGYNSIKQFSNAADRARDGISINKLDELDEDGIASVNVTNNGKVLGTGFWDTHASAFWIKPNGGSQKMFPDRPAIIKFFEGHT